MTPIIALSDAASPHAPPVRSLSEAQAKELAFMFARNIRWDTLSGQSETRLALFRKGAVERGADGAYRVSLIGIASLANYLAWVVRLKVQAAERDAKRAAACAPSIAAE